MEDSEHASEPVLSQTSKRVPVHDGGEASRENNRKCMYLLMYLWNKGKWY